jgi:hypothetical protein
VLGAGPMAAADRRTKNYSLFLKERKEEEKKRFLLFSLFLLFSP